MIPTHYHDDHVAGISTLRDVYGAELWTPENMVDVLARPEAHRLPCLWFEPLVSTRTLALEQPVDWEEFRITPYELTGHARASCGLLVEAHGERVLFGGDQYADPDGLGLNYTYPNLFREADYVHSAQLYARLNPGLILSGHWPPVVPGPEYHGVLLERGQQLHHLHRVLQPHTSRLILRAEPIRVASGAPVTLTVENPTMTAFDGELHVYGAADPARVPVTVPALGHHTLSFVPNGPAGARIQFELRGSPGEPCLFSYATLQDQPVQGDGTLGEPVYAGPAQPGTSAAFTAPAGHTGDPHAT
ncbi:MBL fold metallo-hydrolase [Deinococcus malanensis]|uniref:MBL fold metallo-hydrolase n=1 Tax=Deinococcus malanensis TaxID=1706855 RepID=UPI0036345B18